MGTAGIARGGPTTARGPAVAGWACAVGRRRGSREPGPFRTGVRKEKWTFLERTLVLVKPDGVQRGLCGEIVGRLERKGLRLCAAKLLQPGRELAERHYAPHRERPFFPGLIAFLTSGPVLAMVWEGPRAIEQVRLVMGATDPLKAAPGSVRGELALDVGQNLVHGSDGPESAAREIDLFFRPDEIVPYQRDLDRWAQGAF